MPLLELKNHGGSLEWRYGTIRFGSDERVSPKMGVMNRPRIRMDGVVFVLFVVVVVPTERRKLCLSDRCSEGHCTVGGYLRSTVNASWIKFAPNSFWQSRPSDDAATSRGGKRGPPCLRYAT
jgi:hypothetical protein